jgi:hypothetical protein
LKTLIALILIVQVFTGCKEENTVDAKEQVSLQYAGSTPADSLIKAALGISQATTVDFMKWELLLNEPENSFSLSINFGISQPNTNGFQPGHDTLTYSGKYKIIQLKSDPSKGQAVQLISSGFTTGRLSMALIGNSLLHILYPDDKLMVGNGGWSYTLNLISPVNERSLSLLTRVHPDNILRDTSLQVVFDGRTPCSDFSKEFNLNTVPDCLKLKWRLILNRDAVTLEPSTYELQRTDIRNTGAITGKWTVYCHKDSVVIYMLDPDKPQNSIYFLAGDENVLFFLDRYYRLFSGNREFSYTLNRTNPV